MSLDLRFPRPIYKGDFWDICGRQLFAQVTGTIRTFLPGHLLNPRCHTDIAAFLYFTLPLALGFWSEKTRLRCTASQVPPEKSSSDAVNHRGERIQTLPGATRAGGNLGCEGLQQNQKWCWFSSGSCWPALGLLEQDSFHLGRTLLRQYLLWKSLWHYFS